jgi:hypothetical protein
MKTTSSGVHESLALDKLKVVNNIHQGGVSCVCIKYYVQVGLSLNLNLYY